MKWVYKFFAVLQRVEKNFFSPMDAKEKERQQRFLIGLQELELEKNNVNAFWLATIRSIVPYFKKNDLRHFLHNKKIQSTMFANVAPEEFYFLKNHSHWPYFKNAIVESRIGNPKRYPYYLKSSSNLIHHAYSLQYGFDRLGLEVNRIRSVFEFGGGYGSFCRLLFNTGFTGSYTIYDLKMFSLLQQYFLEHVLTVPINLGGTKNAGNGVNLLFNEVDLEQFNSEVDLMIGLWSFSECPIVLRDKIFNQVKAKNYLIAYSVEFEDYNNATYFNDLADRLTGYAVKQIEIDHARGHFYFLASKK